MSKKEITSLIPKIIHFADIRQFIDAPLFVYSQGMKLRLGFSIAIHTNPDILLLDENIAVGDENFQKKSSQKLLEFQNRGKTIIIASHWVNFLEQHCTRIITLNRGSLVSSKVPPK